MMIFLEADKYFSIDFLLEKISGEGYKIGRLVSCLHKAFISLKKSCCSSISVSPSKCIC